MSIILSSGRFYLQQMFEKFGFDCRSKRWFNDWLATWTTQQSKCNARDFNRSFSSIERKTWWNFSRSKMEIYDRWFYRFTVGRNFCFDRFIVDIDLFEWWIFYRRSSKFWKRSVRCFCGFLFEMSVEFAVRVASKVNEKYLFIKSSTTNF